jgi:hypothetical protein
MRRLAASVVVVLLAGGCASGPHPQPLTPDDVVRMARAGESASAIITKLQATGTVIPLSATDIVRLHERGVPDDVLDWMQLAQINEIRWRQAFAAYGCCWPYGPYYYYPYPYLPPPKRP